MSEISGLQKINRNSRLAQWSAQISDCRSSGMSVTAWCKANGIATSTYYNRQRVLFEALNADSCTKFVEIAPVEIQTVAEAAVATVSIHGITAEIRSGADEATLAALLQAMKSC